MGKLAELREKKRREEEEKRKKEETEEKVKKKKKKKKKRLSRTGSIMMDRNEVLEVPINVDGKITVGLGWKRAKKVDLDASCLMFRYQNILMMFININQKVKMVLLFIEL